MLSRAEDCRATGQRIAADTLKHRRPVVHDMRHDMECGIVPVDELTVVPDFVRLLKCHANSSVIKIRAVGQGFLRTIQETRLKKLDPKLIINANLPSQPRSGLKSPARIRSQDTMEKLLLG